jgi:hypothetical protein
LTVALGTKPIDFGLHPGQQLFGGLRGYPRPLKRLNLFALPKDLAAHVLYLAPDVSQVHIQLWSLFDSMDWPNCHFDC